jgi:1-acyl-sn-glycerol-3-phosphate acyltransferase
MSLANWAVTNSIRGVTRLLCRVEKDWIDQVPRHGPLIIVANHVNFMDVPLMYSHLYPRPMTGFAKSETWDNPLMGMLFNLWDVIPIQRGEPDRGAIVKGLQALKLGKILVMSPEGTRSGDGRLNPGHPGVALVAMKSGAPILPIVYYGGEQLNCNLRHLRRTNFKIKVGKPFKVVLNDQAASRIIRQQIADEIMIQLACLLPEGYRGVYAGRVGEESCYLQFLE